MRQGLDRAVRRHDGRPLAPGYHGAHFDDLLFADDFEGGESAAPLVLREHPVDDSPRVLA